MEISKCEPAISDTLSYDEILKTEGVYKLSERACDEGNCRIVVLRRSYTSDCNPVALHLTRTSLESLPEDLKMSRYVRMDERLCVEVKPK